MRPTGSPVRTGLGPLGGRGGLVGRLDVTVPRPLRLRSTTGVAVRPFRGAGVAERAWGEGVRAAGVRGAGLRGVEVRGAGVRGVDVRGACARGVEVRGACARGVEVREEAVRGEAARGVEERADTVRLDPAEALAAFVVAGLSAPEAATGRPEDSAPAGLRGDAGRGVAFAPRPFLVEAGVRAGSSRVPPARDEVTAQPPERQHHRRSTGRRA